MTTTWHALPNDVVSSRTVNSFKTAWTNTGQKIPQMSELAGSNHRCCAQFMCAQTVVGQRFAGNGPNGLSYTTTTISSSSSSSSSSSRDGLIGPLPAKCRPEAFDAHSFTTFRERGKTG